MYVEWEIPLASLCCRFVQHLFNSTSDRVALLDDLLQCQDHHHILLFHLPSTCGMKVILYSQGWSSAVLFSKS